MKIGIVILASNAYALLGLRLMKQFRHFYQGAADVNFFCASNQELERYVDFPIQSFRVSHDNWVQAVNSKYSQILAMAEHLSKLDYVFYMDADTSCFKPFDESDFIGDLVGAEHDSNGASMLEEKPYDRHPPSSCYIPREIERDQMYYQGAFWGGRPSKVLDLCRTCLVMQNHNRDINHEPPWNDESYLNYLFHYHPPARSILRKDFPFGVSDKGGIRYTREPYNLFSLFEDALVRHKKELLSVERYSLTFQKEDHNSQWTYTTFPVRARDVKREKSFFIRATQHNQREGIPVTPVLETVWQLCDGEHSAREIVNTIKNHYPDEEERVEIDMAEVFDRLVAQGFLSWNVVETRV